MVPDLVELDFELTFEIQEVKLYRQDQRLQFMIRGRLLNEGE